MYKLIFEKNSLGELTRFETQIKERIWNKLQACKENPFRFFKKLTETEGFKLRIGDWRVIADIDRANQTISVLRIGHRKNIYEK